MQKLVIFITEPSRLVLCEIETNPIEITPFATPAEVYGRDWAHLYKTDIVMLVAIETAECEHCSLPIEEKVGWIVNKWIHSGTRAYLCWSNGLTRAMPKGEL